MTEFILETRAWVLFDTGRGEDSRLRMASGVKWDKVVPQDFKKKGRRQAPITTVEVEWYWEGATFSPMGPGHEKRSTGTWIDGSAIVDRHPDGRSR